MKYVIILFTSVMFYSCSDSFINHDLETERIGECDGFPASIKMISNINGERYEFYSCLDDGFDEKNYTVERKGDSIVVDFPETPGVKQALYKITIDIDAKPRYRKILLDGREVNIVPSEK